MTSIDVIGGLYGETCRFPAVKEIFGSGGRAAVALADAGHVVSWHYYCPPELQAEARVALAAPGLRHFPYNSRHQISFMYFHPLSKPIFTPGDVSISPSFKIDAKLALRFGMMEGDPVVRTKGCVYDPQSLSPVPFGKNGSTAEALAVVLNHEEALRYAGASDEIHAIQRIASEVGCRVVLVKAGVDGCRVYENGRLAAAVPAYRSDRVYKIGTGDVFSAAFADAWLLSGKEAVASADYASQCVARYAETRNASTAKVDRAHQYQPAPGVRERVVRVVGPTSTMSGLWLVNEANEALLRLGVTVLSDAQHPEHYSPSAFAALNESDMKRNTAILALLESLDNQALLVVRHAVDACIPVVAYARGAVAVELSKSFFQSVEICDDFATALYHVIWSA
jgi:pfkB family carbohydrate kinase